MNKTHQFWLSVWYGKSKWIYLLLPLSWLFALVASLRARLLKTFFQKQLSVPVIVVGNISVGGTGKTPLIVALVKHLQSLGYRPGVVSRGYGGKAPSYPYLLNAHTNVGESGDEPLLIFKATGTTVCVAPDRVAAAQILIEQGCDIILSDDGLQHYRLGRVLEIAVVDGQRQCGNGHLLPAGPLREPAKRLKHVDMVVVNNPPKSASSLAVHDYFPMHIAAHHWLQLSSGATYPLTDLEFKTPVHALAGIGNPERFFTTLDGLSITYYAHAFPDHHQFSAHDFASFNDDLVLMTEKDAVKCTELAKPNWYALVVTPQLNKRFWQVFEQKLETIKREFPTGQQ